ncbi:MAG TPA: calcium/proton exchanger [Leptolyngbyaceae cyanobacterium M65_K2018_010]|nr:calcium/proton exchanger [Leptolyngbyaceae cyanobacterium M65_K2018_010]
MPIKPLISYGLLLFIPISILAERLEWGALTVFGLSALAILPLAIWLSTATEELAVITGPTIGGLVNALFGNATELIIALVALKSGLIDIVKASITGSILANTLLVLGLSMLVGGLRYKEQTFNQAVAGINGSTMGLAVTAMVIPALVINTSNIIEPQVIRHLSLVVAIVMIAVYGLTLLFSLKTHSYLYDVGVSDLEEAETSHPSGEGAKPKLWLWVGVLLVATIGVAIESEIFVGAVEATAASLGLTDLFTGIILLPLVGGAAEYVTAVRMAAKDNMDLAVSVAMGSSLLVALLVAPILVIVGEVIGQPMDLNFGLFEVVAVVLAVATVNLIGQDGRSNWLEGVLLLSTFALLGAAFFFHPV